MITLTDLKLVCKKCNVATREKTIVKDHFKIKCWKCPSCGKIWYDPYDLEKYKKFKELKRKKYRVKLRIVGNSWAISIPKEIIEFEEIEKKINKVISLWLEEPKKLIINFEELEKFIRKKILED